LKGNIKFIGSRVRLFLKSPTLGVPIL